MTEESPDETAETVEQSASDEDTDDEGENPIIICECSEKFVAVYEDPDRDLLWQTVGDTPEEVLDDMIETLNYLPSQMQEVRSGEAAVVSAVPLQRGDDDV
jgi:hypothetical protein